MNWLRRWWNLPRVPESEIMEDGGEVEAYSSAAGEAYLDRIDDTFVKHALRVLPAGVSPQSPGRALDIGCGPGQIVLKFAQRLPGWRLFGVDRSANMVRQGIAALTDPAVRKDHGVISRVHLFLADGSALPFDSGSMDMVLCNSVLHHLQDPLRLFAEMARVAAPTATILLRDLQRPSRLAYPLHVRWYGRHYSGLMYKLYCDSVHAAYTPAELAGLLRGSPLQRARIFTLGRTHLGFQRQAG
jgi:ubiquinone/menaquinone biosynthesis C-methylase UbiE